MQNMALGSRRATMPGYADQYQFSGGSDDGDEMI